MNLNFKNQEKENKTTGIKIFTLYCSKKVSKNCKFHLEFRTGKQNPNYKLTDYYNIHNHEMDIYDSRHSITEEISQNIILLSKTTTDTPTITSLINSKFKTNFLWRTIYYQLTKLKDVEYGKLNKDASSFIKILENDANSRRGF